MSAFTEQLKAALEHPCLGPIFISVLGLIWGSFYNVCIARIPDRISLFGRSCCPRCLGAIPWYANIPILSFIALKGKCLNCRGRISFQYPLIEFISALLFLAVFKRYGISWQWLSYTLLGSFLLIISVIDLYLQIIPDELSLSGILIGFGFCFLTGDLSWKDSLLGIFLGGGIFFTIATLYEKMAKREGLGGGDVKLLAMIGAWLGWQSVLPVIVLSSAWGSIFGIGLMLFKKKNFRAAIPFGPFLATAAWTYLWWATPITNFLIPTSP